MTHNQLAWLRLRFEFDYAALLGVEPDWLHCCHSGAPLFDHKDGRLTPRHQGLHRFDREAGGLFPLKRSTRPSRHDISPQAMLLLANWRLTSPHKDPPLPSIDVLSTWQPLLTSHLLNQLDRIPRSLKLLPRLLSNTNTP